VGDEVFQVDVYLDCDIDGYSVCDEYAKDEDIACEYCRHNVVKKYVKTSIYKHGMFEEIGKTVFLTKEEAERALKERKNNG
jgi:DNA-directed RNA polymerase subunit RPC12/RpoP